MTPEVFGPEAFGIVSVVVALLAYPPYIFSVLKGKTRPHVFSWVLWSLLTCTAWAIQVVAGAGPGAWSTAVTGLFTILITVFSFRYGEKTITRTDWISFLSGLLAIPLWIATKDPTASAILVTVIDGFGFYPTFRKSWHKPYEEKVSTHALSLAKHVFSLPAMAIVNIPTAFYSVGLVLLNAGLVSMIMWRRCSVKKT